MSNADPIYINQFATRNNVSDFGGGARFDNGESGLWKSGWHGYIPLWRAFWVYFLFGHGAVFGIGCGLIVLSLLAGNIFSHLSTTLMAMALRIGVTIFLIIYWGFAFWVVVTVWRSSRNCYYKRHCWYARIAMMIYVIAVIFPVLWYLAG